MMGSPDFEKERSIDGDYAETQRSVRLTRGFWLADTACTQELWEIVMNSNPSRFKGTAKNPVEQVSWLDICLDFIPRLKRLMPGIDFVLPTEAQWEYACRAGTETPFFFGGNIKTSQVNYDGNNPYNNGRKGEYRGRTVPVRSLPSNDWGLYEMHGNVYEWCFDNLTSYAFAGCVDPACVPLSSDGNSLLRIVRGGGARDFGRRCRSANRRAVRENESEPYIGFRLAISGFHIPSGSRKSNTLRLPKKKKNDSPDDWSRLSMGFGKNK